MEPKIIIQRVSNGFTVEVDPHDQEPDTSVFKDVTELIVFLVEYYTDGE